MINLLLGIVVSAFAGSILYARWHMASSLAEKTALAETLHDLRSLIEVQAMGAETPSELSLVEDRLHYIDQRLQELTIAVAEGITHVERAEARVRTTVRRARKELEASGLEHAGLTAEFEQLSVINGGGGDPSGVPPMPTEMASDQESSIPGVSLETLRRARGLG